MILFSVRLEFPAALPVADNIHVRTFGDNAQAGDLRARDHDRGLPFYLQLDITFVPVYFPPTIPSLGFWAPN
jgi:hypothetical protein